jgi:hypothetical protein
MSALKVRLRDFGVGASRVVVAMRSLRYNGRMGVSQWIGKHWFDLVQSAGIIASLWFAAVSLRSDAKTKRVPVGIKKLAGWFAERSDHSHHSNFQHRKTD